MRFRSNMILNIPQYYFHMAAILKNGCHFFQQNIARVVHLEVVQGGPLNTLIPNTCLQQPMSGKPGLPPRYGHSQKNVLPTRVQTPQKWTLNGVLRHIKFTPLNGITPVKHTLNGVIRGVTYPKWRTLLWYTVP